jgi:poly-gamma-glutamate capsule biosynthesis protein CapA/YwtB (metallophosphatase superfamily)
MSLVLISPSVNKHILDIHRGGQVMFRTFLLSLLIFQSPAESNTFLFQEEFSEFMEVDPEISIIFAGDTMMDLSVKERIRKHGADYPFHFVKKQVIAADYAVLNLETAVTTSNDKFPKIYNYKADPEALAGVKNAGFDLVTLANNHAMDFHEEGLLDTMKHVKDYGLDYVGAGANAEEAYSAHIVNIKGKKIAFLSFSHVLPSVAWYASPNKPGLASGYQLDRMKFIVEEEKSKSDFVFVNIHWGKMNTNKPVYYQKSYARALIDVGADGVIGHHPHWLQGIEYYNERPIAYSLGNFLFYNYVKGRTAETGLFTVTIEQNNIKTSFHPYYIENDQITKLSTNKEQQLLNYLESISTNITIEGFDIIPLQ